MDRREILDRIAEAIDHRSRRINADWSLDAAGRQYNKDLDAIAEPLEPDDRSLIDGFRYRPMWVTVNQSEWHPLTFRERLRLLPVVHDLWFLTYYVGVRDRLRCPKCKAVGTWKPHGSLIERTFYGDIPVRRWLCKWCGHYTGPRGRTVAYPGAAVWELPEPGVDRQPTPAEVVRASLGKTWPWLG